MSGQAKMTRRWVSLDSIHIGSRHRAPDIARVAEIAKSIADVGLLYPPAVRFVESMVFDGVEEFNVPILIVGHHRILALHSLSQQSVECDVYDVDPLKAELMEIAANLHRAELSALERSDQIARWIALTEADRVEVVQSAQFAPIENKRADGKGHRPESGVNAAARELKIERTAAQRAVKVASLSPEAKEAAREVGLDDNRTALLEAARETEPAKQIAVLHGRGFESAEARRAVRSQIGLRAADGATSDIDKLKKQLAAAQLKIEEKEGQRKAAEMMEKVAARQVDDATNRAMYAEAEVTRLRAENDRLQAENAELRQALAMPAAA